MIEIRRGTIMDVRLDSTPGSETGKTRPCLVVTNVEIVPTPANGLSKRSLADCLQTRPIDRRIRRVRIRGRLDADLMVAVNRALRCVFALDGTGDGAEPG